MGACLGHCFNSNSRKYDKCHSLHCCHSNYVQFDLGAEKKEQELQNEVSLELVENSWSAQCSVNHASHACLPFSHHIDSVGIRTDLDFQTLDAKALLVPQGHPGFRFAQEFKSMNSTPPSSLDLEWEHEASINLPTRKEDGEDSDSTGVSFSHKFPHHYHHRSFPHSARLRSESRRGSTTIESLTESKDGSRMTSPESLEWDFVDATIPTIDPETEQLLAEIERLASNALQETGNITLTSHEDVFTDRETYL